VRVCLCVHVYVCVCVWDVCVREYSFVYMRVCVLSYACVCVQRRYSFSSLLNQTNAIA